MSEPSKNHNTITFSCERNTIGFNQPKGRHFTSLGLWQRRDKLVEELVNIVNSTQPSKKEMTELEINEYSKIQSIVSEQREIDPDWHLVVRQQGGDCLRVSHYDCYCNSGSNNKCNHKAKSLIENRVLKNDTEVLRSIQDAMNAIDINTSFDDNLGTMMKLYFFIKRLKLGEFGQQPHSEVSTTKG
jgi:hypothetical protein